MDDLHKPLGQDQGSDTPKVRLKPLLAVGAAVLLGLAGYVYVGAQQENNVVVALGKEETIVSPKTNTSVNGQQSPTDNSTIQPPDSSQEDVSIFNDKGELDLSGVKKLSPIEPLDGISPEDPGPQFDDTAFKPKPVVKQRGSAWLPQADLIEDSEFGPLPQVSDGGIRPLDAYSESTGLVGANRIAVIVGGMGLSQTGTQSAIRELPSEVTLGFSPFGLSLQRWMQVARKEGHEVSLQLPMEPLGYPTIDPGPQTLTSKVPTDVNLRNLRWSLARMTNYPLVTNYLGAAMVSKPKALGPIMEEIKRRGLGYIDDGSVSSSRASSVAKEIALPYAQGMLTIDSKRTEEGIKASLRNLEAVAKRRGFAIGFATAFPQSVELIAKWAETTRERDILLVPASNLLKDPRR